MLHKTEKGEQLVNIQKILIKNSEADFAAFQRRLLPTLPAESILGVRTPLLKKLAAELIKKGGYEPFLSSLPHKYFEENQLHAFIISSFSDFEKTLGEVSRFLPYVDNWATCDQLIPRAFGKSPEALLPYISKWIKSREVYTARFAIGLLMRHFLDERFKSEYLRAVSEVRSREYYINMMSAWYFATALTKRYEETLPYFTERQLDAWVHNKAIQKARESFRVPPERKVFLNTLKTKPLSLRKYNKADAKSVLSWIDGEDVFYKWSAGRLGEYPLSEKVFEDFFKGLAPEEEAVRLVAYDEKGICGFLTMRYPDGEKSALRFGFIITDSSRRGEGLGRRMLSLALAYAKKKFNAEKITLGVFANNPTAKRCYEHVGFKDSGIREEYSINGEKWDCIEMEFFA